MPSERNSGTWYNVNFNEPSCDCYDWLENLVPCKHMDIILRVKLVKWESFPLHYRSNPLLNLDDVVVEVNRPVPVDIIDEEFLHEAAANNIDFVGDDDDGDANACIDLPDRIVAQRTSLIRKTPFHPLYQNACVSN